MNDLDKSVDQIMERYKAAPSLQEMSPPSCGSMSRRGGFSTPWGSGLMPERRRGRLPSKAGSLPILKRESKSPSKTSSARVPLYKANYFAACRIGSAGPQDLGTRHVLRIVHEHTSVPIGTKTTRPFLTALSRPNHGGARSGERRSSGWGAAPVFAGTSRPAIVPAMYSN